MQECIDQLTGFPGHVVTDDRHNANRALAQEDGREETAILMFKGAATAFFRISGGFWAALAVDSAGIHQFLVYMRGPNLDKNRWADMKMGAADG